MSTGGLVALTLGVSLGLTLGGCSVTGCSAPEGAPIDGSDVERRASLKRDPQVRLAAVSPRVRTHDERMVACAIRDGELWCWGSPVFTPGPGEAPWPGSWTSLRPSVLPPYRVLPPAPVKTIDLGGDLGCAVVGGGALHCFGMLHERAAPLGPRDEAPKRFDSFVPIALPAPVEAVAVENRAACVRLVDASLWCWGVVDGRVRGAHALRPVRDGAGRPFTDAVRFAPGAAIDAKGGAWTWDLRAARMVVRRVPLPPVQVVSVGGLTARFWDGAGGAWRVDLSRRPSPVEPLRDPSVYLPP